MSQSIQISEGVSINHQANTKMRGSKYKNDICAHERPLTYTSNSGVLAQMMSEPVVVSRIQI